MPAISKRDLQALLSARLLLAEGKVERVSEHVEVPVVLSALVPELPSLVG